MQQQLSPRRTFPSLRNLEWLSNRIAPKESCSTSSLRASTLTKISFKEYGKQKIYLAGQDQFGFPNNEELNQMKEENAKLQEQLTEQKKAIAEVEGEIKVLKSNLTTEHIQAKKTKLVNEMEEKLIKLRQGVTLVGPEEREHVDKMYSGMINQWKRRKKMFKDIWDAITENSPKSFKEFKEELGIEYDEDVGVSLQSYSDNSQR